MTYEPALAYATATSASRLMLASLSIVPSSCSMPKNKQMSHLNSGNYRADAILALIHSA